MSKRYDRRRRSSETQGPNLAPFMNMVVILIPMLLLSVVFLKVGVINVTSPSFRSVGQTSSEGENEELDLTVGISKGGFEIATGDETFSSVDGCPSDGPTVCLVDSSVEIGSQIEQIRRARENGDVAKAESRLERLVAAYDFATLYSELRELKDKHPGETTVRVSASPDIPYELLVRVMDAVRYKLERPRYASNESFWRANVEVRKDGRREELFSQPVLAVGR